MAFAGFASLVGILGQRSARDDPRVLGARMRGMVLFSLLAVGFSLLPIIVSRYDLDRALVWRTASAVFAVATASVGVWSVFAVSRLIQLGVPSRPIVRRVVPAVLFTAIPSTVILLTLNSLIFPTRLLSAAYVTALGVVLFLSAFAFSFILFSFLPGLDPASPDSATATGSRPPEPADGEE